jgi:hypothetical protein
VGVKMNFTLSHELDYSLLSLNERKNKVEEIVDKYDNDLVNYYENYFKANIGQTEKTSEFDYVSKDLEKVADYLLYMDNKEQREKQKQENLLNRRQTDNRKKKEVLTDNFTFVETGKKEFTKNTKIYGKIKVVEKDRKEHKELADTGRMIAILKEQILSKKDSKGNSLSNEQLKKLRWYLIEIGKDEVAIKEQLKKYINFKNIQPSIPFHNLQHFSFANIQHVKTLFDNYQKIKENSFDKTDNDFKILIIVFEQLVDKVINEPILKMIFNLKIDGLSQKAIIEEVAQEFNIKISASRLTALTTHTIPSLIVEKYKEEFEEWIYTFMKKGNYKQCSTCNENRLANKKYFTNDTTRKDGLFPMCKDCKRKHR